MLAAQAPAHADIAEAGFRHLGWAVDVAQIHHQRRLQRRLHLGEVQGAEFVPFGQDHHAVGAFQRVIGVLRRDPGSDAWRASLCAFRIIGADGGAGLLQIGQDHQAGRIAHVVGVGLEGQAQHRDGLALDAAEGRFDLLGHGQLARVIDRHHRFDDAGWARPAPARVCTSASVSLGKQEPP